MDGQRTTSENIIDWVKAIATIVFGVIALILLVKGLKWLYHFLDSIMFLLLRIFLIGLALTLVAVICNKTIGDKIPEWLKQGVKYVLVAICGAPWTIMMLFATLAMLAECYHSCGSMMDVSEYDIEHTHRY